MSIYLFDYILIFLLNKWIEHINFIERFFNCIWSFVKWLETNILLIWFDLVERIFSIHSWFQNIRIDIWLRRLILLIIIRIIVLFVINHVWKYRWFLLIKIIFKIIFVFIYAIFLLALIVVDYPVHWYQNIVKNMRFTFIFLRQFTHEHSICYVIILIFFIELINIIYFDLDWFIEIFLIAHLTKRFEILWI